MSIETADKPRHIRRRRSRGLSAVRLTALLLALGVVARVLRCALNFPLWGDEAFVAVDFLIRDFRGLIAPLTYHQIVPLLFMWAELAVTRVLGLSEWALRLLPLLSGLGTLVLFWWFVRRNFSRRVTLLAVGFLGAAYYAIRHTTEVKPYSTDLLVSLALTAAGWSAYCKPHSVLRWTVLVVLAALAVWASYPAVFVAGGVGVLLALLVFRQRSVGAGLGWAIFAVALVASWVTMFIVYAEPHAAAVPQLMRTEMWQRTFPPLTQPVKLLVWLGAIHAGNMFAYPLGGKNGGSAFTLIVFLIGCWRLWRTRRDLLLLLLAPFLLNFVAAVVQRYPYGGTIRTSLYLAPAICLLAGVGLDTLLKRALHGIHRRNAYGIAGLIFAGIALGSIFRDALQPYKKAANFECRRVLRAIGARVAPGDRVVAFHATSEDAPHAPYIFPWRGDGAQFIFYLTRFVPVPVEWAPPPESVVESDRGHTWLIVYDGEEYRGEYDEYRAKQGTDYAARHPPLDDQLAAYLQVVSAGLGPADHESFTLQRKHDTDWQTIDIYCFPSRR